MSNDNNLNNNIEKIEKGGVSLFRNVILPISLFTIIAFLSFVAGAFYTLTPQGHNVIQEFVDSNPYISVPSE